MSNAMRLDLTASCGHRAECVVTYSTYCGMAMDVEIQECPFTCPECGASNELDDYGAILAEVRQALADERADYFYNQATDR